MRSAPANGENTQLSPILPPVKTKWNSIFGAFSLAFASIPIHWPKGKCFLIKHHFGLRALFLWYLDITYDTHTMEYYTYDKKSEIMVSIGKNVHKTQLPSLKQAILRR